MTEGLETIAVAIHAPDNPECPFCPGEKEGPWTTHPGSANNAKDLRRIMNKPAKLEGLQSGARPKDGENRRQSPDSRRPIYRSKRDGVIHHHSKYGDYGDQAHHALSGNQILDGHPIETLIDISHGAIDEDTGYSVNNCANGVCLPAYPKSYGKRGATVKWSAEEPELKHTIMEEAMKAGKGQAHIGEHDIAYDPDDETVAKIHHTTYPAEAKRMLAELYDVITRRWIPECPWCNEGDPPKKKDPLPPPYRVNKSLDDVSSSLITHVTSAPANWEYFISPYARDYHYKICTHPKSRAG